MVLVEDGNIVVLGGLIEDKTDNSKSQVPILGNIPLIGELFKYENRKRTKTNLLVFLRPYVVRDEATSSALAMDRYEYIRGQVANSTVADNLIFRDLQSRQIPEKPPVPPSIRQSQQPAAPPPQAPVDPKAPVPAPSGAAPPPPAASAAPAAAAPSSGAFAAQGPGPGSGIQLVQVATVNEIGRGRDLQRQLRDAGFDAYWESVKTGGGDVVRVRVAVNPATQSVTDTVTKLRAMGFDPVVVAP
jgi:general secretion pathway protein D